MHFDLQNLKEILLALDPIVVGDFFTDYDRSVDRDTETYSRVCKRILTGEQDFSERSIFRKGLISKYSEMFAALDEAVNPSAKQQLTKGLYTFFSLYDKYYGTDYERYLADINELQYLGIDFLSFTSFNTANDTHILSHDGKKVNSLKIFSDGIMRLPTLYKKTACDSSVQMVGCMFLLHDANYMIQSYPSTITGKDVVHYLSIKTPNIDMSEIGLLPLDSCDFEFNDEISESADKIDSEKARVLKLPSYEGKGPQSLYRA